ncbi:MAG: beta-lactamase family protein, partial [Acidobacteriaceae bacterium]|nr:beta-lactamase family protein [Acidobacteriaceae bacterium]
MRSVACWFLLAATCLLGSDMYPEPRFTDPDRITKLRGAFPKIDALFRKYAEESRIPGIVWGVVIDGQLAHSGVQGLSNREKGARVNTATAFRIASMTKSFTVLAILRL